MPRAAFPTAPRSGIGADPPPGVALGAGVTVAGGSVGVGVGVGAATITIPLIPMPPTAPWITQWYGKVPGVENVWENIAPVERMPESHTSGPLVASLVLECGEPSHVHVTISPGATVTVFGLKEREGPTLTV